MAEQRRATSWGRLSWGLACAALAWASLSGVAWGRTWVLHQRPVVLEPGLRLRYALDQQHGGLGRYTAQVEVESVSQSASGAASGLRFGWALEGVELGRGRAPQGTVEVEDLGGSRALNAWWTSGRDTKTRDTHLWLSAEACEELVRTGETRYALDIQVRRDRPLKLTRIGEVGYSVEVDGVEVALRALEVRSELGDRLVVLRDCSHALVLSSELPELTSMRVVSVETGRGALRRSR